MRWYRATRERQHYMETSPVVLRCPCGHRAESIADALKHRADYHNSGVCSVRMVLDQTFEWKYKRVVSQEGMFVSNLTMVNRANHRFEAAIKQVLA